MAWSRPTYIVSCDLLFIFINHIISLKQIKTSFVHFLESLLLYLYDNVGKESQKFSNNESSALGCCLAFA